MIGGIAVTIDWERPIDPRRHRGTADLVPHRATGTTATHSTDGAMLTEMRSAPGPAEQPTITTLGDVVIVGDMVLWNTDGLVARAGGHTVTRGMSHRDLILAAHRRTGLDFLDDLYGEFAFVIWDAATRTVTAVRDHVGAKALFVQRTNTGLRFATEPKQLAATSETAIEPNARMISEFLIRGHRNSLLTFFDGIDRIPPSNVLVADAASERITRYWNPGDATLPPPPPGDVVEEFREQLVGSVRRRVDQSSGVVAHLSGGLDSGSVTASAHILATHEQLGSPFCTATVAFPGFPEVDETRWVADVVRRQPFEHHQVEPTVASLDVFTADMWATDTPDANPIRVMWAGMGPIAERFGADTVLMGMGGDEINLQSQVLIDRLRYGSIRSRVAAANAHRRRSSISLTSILASEARDNTPDLLRRAARRVLPARTSIDVRTPDLAAIVDEPFLLAGLTQEFAKASQFGVVAVSQTATITRIIELESAQYASLGKAVTHPYLDRMLIEYLASIPPDRRPFDGRSKPLIRMGYRGWLPDSVLDRATNTVSDPYLDAVFPSYFESFIGRYPKVPESASPYVDDATYRSLVDAVDTPDMSGRVRELLWRSWKVMAWLDGLSRYRM